MKAVIHFDGGCSPNPGSKYGSFSISLDEQFVLERRRFELGHGTNNEAEFESLIAALHDLHSACARAGIDPKEMRVEIFTDSTIVRNWLQRFHKFNPAKAKNPRRLVMGNYAARCIQSLSRFREFCIQWNSRDVNVDKFGH